MDVINDLTSSLSSDLNSTELAKDLGLGFLAKSTAINGAVNLGIKLLEILFTLFLCWLMIRISSKLVNKFLRTQVQREKLSMSERKAKTLSTVTGSILKYVIYFIGLMSILKQLGVSSESLVVIASAGSVAIGLGAQSIAGDMMEGFFILFEDHYAVGDIVTIQGITGTVERSPCVPQSCAISAALCISSRMALSVRSPITAVNLSTPLSPSALPMAKASTAPLPFCRMRCRKPQIWRLYWNPPPLQVSSVWMIPPLPLKLLQNAR